MKPTLRKSSLTIHVIVSVGWLGAAAAYLALAIVGLTSRDPQLARAVYMSMEVIGWYVIVPLGLLTLLAGLIQSLGTPWGLFRHWWIVAKFALTTGSIGVLLMHMQAVTHMSDLATNASLSATDLRPLRIQLVTHPAAGLLVLLAATVLSVYQPWGLTPYGRRKENERPSVSQARSRLIPESATVRAREAGASPRWALVVGIHAVGLAVLFVVWHITNGGMRSH